jgi:hypothetical protein
MNEANFYLTVDGSAISLRPIDNIRFVTPSRDQHPATVAARLARSSRLAIDPAYPVDSLVVWGDSQKLQEIPSYPDVQNARASFQDSEGHLLVLTNEILISFEETQATAIVTVY